MILTYKDWIVYRNNKNVWSRSFGVFFEILYKYLVKNNKTHLTILLNLSIYKLNKRYLKMSFNVDKKIKRIQNKKKWRSMPLQATIKSFCLYQKDLFPKLKAVLTFYSLYILLEYTNSFLFLPENRCVRSK